MYVRFLVPLKPMSINKMYRSYQGRSIKSAEARQWEAEFNHHLAEYAHEALFFLQSFDEEEHALDVEIIFYLLESDYITKGGRMNKRVLDVDNGIKSSLDQIFRFMNIDDGLIKSVKATKLPSSKDCTEIVVRRSAQVKVALDPIPKAMLSTEQH